MQIVKYGLVFACLSAGCQPPPAESLTAPVSVEKYMPFMHGALLLWSTDGLKVRGRGEGWKFRGRQTNDHQLVEFELSMSGRRMSTGRFTPEGIGVIENYAIYRNPDGSKANQVHERVFFREGMNPQSVVWAPTLGVRIEEDLAWEGASLQYREWNQYKERSGDAIPLEVSLPQAWVGSGPVAVEVLADGAVQDRLTVELFVGNTLKLECVSLIEHGSVRVKLVESEAEWMRQEIVQEPGAKVAVVQFAD